ncbi:MAG: hypothetical protein DLM50_01250 [Candidatus Meridianibacter frigidus]|nr:MAG: hypothetical protein DLM50_01250 [Candidatus Eremiobacteraeota bacterium]
MNEFVTVFSAEVTRRVKSRPFLIGLVIGLLVIAGMIRAPALLGAAFSQELKQIVLTGSPQMLARAKLLLEKDFNVELQPAAPQTPTLSYLQHHHNAGALVRLQATGKQLHVTVHTRDLSSFPKSTLEEDLAPLNLALATASSQAVIDKSMNVPITVVGVNSKFGNEAASKAAEGIAFTLLFFLYISILLNSQLIMTSVAEEKTSRIAELLIASVNPSALLAGKIAAAAVMAIIQMASWLVVGFLLSPHAGTSAASQSVMGLSGASTAITPLDIFAFIAFFILGYLQLSTLFAGLASLINRTEDIGSLSGPLVFPVVGAFFLAIYALNSPGSMLVTVTSFIPILAPFVMFARVAVSNVPLWQFILSLLINTAAVWLIALAAGKIYRVGMMLYGRPPKLKQIWATLRT